LAEQASPPWLVAQRRLARTRFEASDWPAPTVEEWRRTDLKRFAPDGFPASREEIPDASKGACGVVVASPEARRPGAEENWDGMLRLVGSTCTDLGLSEEAARAGLRLCPLADALVRANGSLESILTRGLERADNRFLFWHYRSWSNGVYLQVPPGLKLARPVYVELQAEATTRAEHPHVVVALGEDAEAEVVVSQTGAVPVGSVWNATVDIQMGARSALRYAELQNLGPEALIFQHTWAVVPEGARLVHTAAVFGGRLHKSRLVCDLDGHLAEACLQGLFFADRTQHLDIMTVQRHVSAGAASNTLYKGVAKDTANTVFQGLIDVAEGASKTDAYLSNRNLVLGDTARANSLPSLAIRNNDLRCTHGSTTGRIDPEQRFYLMTRGFSREEAEQMLVQGFAEEVLADSPARLAERARELLGRKLLRNVGQASARAPGDPSADPARTG
jgi:Fe-S cluster assembly protein SufD